MATLQWLEQPRSGCDSAALPAVAALRIPKLRCPCCTGLMFPGGGSWGWSRLPQHKGQSPLSFCSLLIFWEVFCVRGFENRAVSWVCFPMLPWNPCFARKLLKSVVPQLGLVFAFSRLAPCLYASGVLGHTSTSLLKELLPHYPF